MMSEQAFEPPSPDRFRAYLEEHEPRQVSIWVARGPLLALIGIIAVSLFTAGNLGLVLPCIGLGAVLIYLYRRGQHTRRLQAQARHVQELSMLRHHADALRHGWQLLPHLTTMPALHGRTIAIMSYGLDLIESYDAAITGYDYLLERLPGDHPGAWQLGIQRAISALFADRLTDADNSLRRLRNSATNFVGSPLHAGFLLAELIQDVRTHHFAEALTLSDAWLDALRPLGVEAGYGHALLALCYHETDRAEESQQFWQAATTLLPSSVLLHRFPELKLLT